MCSLQLKVVGMKFAYANSMMEYSARLAIFFYVSALHWFRQVFCNDIEWLVCNNLQSLSLASRKLEKVGFYESVEKGK